ncbi:MAG: TetR/AcrR family transcriptional regulator [Eggerthellaceae bacterium]|nr:TetR/AcrR family transcriptional regulator [Eggerthellaceae bacterium]
MPKIVDDVKRKERIAEAVWFLTSKGGLHAATMRSVAKECGLSVGAIQHSFPSQAQLQRFSMSLLVNRAKSRIDCLAKERYDNPMEKAATLLEQVLPLDEERIVEARVWAMFTIEALVDPNLEPYSLEMGDIIENLCRDCLLFLQSCGLVNGKSNISARVLSLSAVLDGLTIHILAKPTSEEIVKARESLRDILAQVTA